MKLATIFALLPSLLTALSSTAGPVGEEHRKIPIRLHISAYGKEIFDQVVPTRGRDVTTYSGGTHKCDGTNNGANQRPGATPTSALADAAERAKFTFDGTWFDSFEDFFITEIAGVSGSCNWLIRRNGKLIDVGGCQQELDLLDRVSFTCE